MKDRVIAANRAASSSAWRRVLAIALVCTALIAVTLSDQLHGLLSAMLHTAEGLMSRHSLAGATVFACVAAVSAMFAAVSSAVLVPAAIVAWGAPISLMLLWAGWCAGGVASYYLGRLPGRSAARWLSAEAAVHGLERRLRPDTPFSLILALQLALPSELQGWLLGLVRYPFRRYLAGLAVAEFPYAVATLYMSTGVVERRTTLVWMPALFVAFLAVFSLYKVKRFVGIAATTDASHSSGREDASQVEALATTSRGTDNVEGFK